VAWSAWNYLTTSSSAQSPNIASGSLQTVSLTYNMNILQHISTSKFGNVLVTMNPPHRPDPALTQAEVSYRHPLYNAAAVRAQCRLHEIQGKRGIWFCGAWTNYGFHEDGFASGMGVGRRLGGSVPWEVVDAKFMRGRKPVLAWKDYAARLIVSLLQFVISLALLALTRCDSALTHVRKGKLQ
jgi:predicted NAD/FAD-binding protein